MSRERYAVSLALCLTFLDAFFLFYVLRPAKSGFYFLNVGQGDSELVRLPGGMDMLIDGGPGSGMVVRELERILPFYDRYIDLVVMTHAEADHFGGLTDILARYEVGAFLWNGVKGTAASLADLEEELMKHGARVVELAAGDRIRHGTNVLHVVWPIRRGPASESFEAGPLEFSMNDSSLVIHADIGGVRALFTGDISFSVERRSPASESFEAGLLELSDVDILKVAHHGSKYSSSQEFLEQVKPRIAIIEVGENGYGHPASETLERLAAVGARVYRTDRNGTIVVPLE